MGDVPDDEHFHFHLLQDFHIDEDVKGQDDSSMMDTTYSTDSALETWPAKESTKSIRRKHQEIN